ncbi:cytochrome P450 [Camillea tinctor]|nr:cytochrome P450 [Camillea tinctor]
MAGGVTIDLSGLSSITLSPPGVSVAAVGVHISPTLSVGVGATWGSVYTHLDTLKLGVNGARATGVGVGGLTLGGGISYFGPRFGWTCDSVTSFEVVLADGTLVNANDNENPDLLWALRGGTNNLGIVTRVDLQTFPQGNLWGGQVVRPWETAEQQILALAEFNDPEGYDEFASLITTFAYSGAQDLQVVVNNMEYTKPVADPPIFHTLTSMAALSSTQRITNMSDLAAETEANSPNGFRQASATLTITSSVAAINATVLAWSVSITSVRGIPGIVWAVGMDPLPPPLYEPHAGTNALGLVDRKGKTLIVINLSMTWSNAADDDAVDKAARELIAAIQRDVSELDALDPFLYVNYAAPWQRPIEGYGEASVERLQRVQRTYDPGRVFTNLVPGGFKIPSLTMIISLILSSALAYLVWTVVCLEANVRKARPLQVPVVRIPFSPESNIWVVFQPLVWTVLDRCVPIRWSSYPDFRRFNEVGVEGNTASNTDCSRGMLHSWTTKHQSKVPSLEGDLRALTFNVLVATAFQEPHDVKGGTPQPGEGEATTEVYRDTLHVVLENAILLMLIPYRHLTGALVPRGLAKIGRAAASFKSILMKVLAEETTALGRDSTAPGGLVTPLVRALRPQTATGEGTNSGEDTANKIKRGGLSADEVLGNIFAINFAGHDTVLIALTFALTLLAAHPDVQEWLHEETTTILGERGPDGGDEWDYEIFPKLNRCHAVFLETLRLFAPITGVPKMAAERATRLWVGGRVVPIPTGIEVFPVLLGMQTDARYWGAEPDEWRPSRWILHPGAAANEELLVPRKGTFFPWSDGPQNCVGKKFSVVEGVALLACLFHGHRLYLERDDGETVAQARKRARDCADDVNYNLLLRMNHPERVRLECVKRRSQVGT